MRKRILLLIICIPNLLLAQSKWSIGASASLDYSYRFNEMGNEKMFGGEKTIDEIENAGIGFTVGFKAKYSFTKNIAIITGLAFWQNNYKSSNIRLSRIDPMDLLVPDEYSWAYQKEYLQLPLLASFYFGKKFKLGVTTGLALNFSTLQLRYQYNDFNNGTSITITRNELDKSGNNMFFTSWIIGAGAAYDYKKWEFMLEPTFNCNLFDISPKTELRLWNAGMNLSVFYKIGVYKKPN